LNGFNKQTVFLILLTGVNVSVAEVVADVSGEVTIMMADGLKYGSATIPSTEKFYVNIHQAFPETEDQPELLIIHTRVAGKSHYYSIKVKRGKYVYLLSQSTLKASKGSPEFLGVKSGESFFLLAGKETFRNSLDMGMLIDSGSVVVNVK